MKTDVDTRHEKENMTQTTLNTDLLAVRTSMICGNHPNSLNQSVMLIVLHTVELVHDNIKHYNV